jgi:hypothetical protein
MSKVEDVVLGLFRSHALHSRRKPPENTHHDALVSFGGIVLGMLFHFEGQSRTIPATSRQQSKHEGLQFTTGVSTREQLRPSPLYIPLLAKMILTLASF